MKAKVIKFPGNTSPLRDLPKDHDAPIVILPVVRIERNPDVHPKLRRQFARLKKLRAETRRLEMLTRLHNEMRGIGT